MMKKELTCGERTVCEDYPSRDKLIAFHTSFAVMLFFSHRCQVASVQISRILKSQS
jgi:hypothetical protein